MPLRTSDQLDKFSPAMVAAQKAIEHAEKSSVNPAFKSKYADLTDVWAACKDALNSNGIAVVQGAVESGDGVLHLCTRLLHTSGQWIENEAVMPLAKKDPQGFGSAMTYARRYNLAAMVGVTQEDDDGNAASGPSKPPAPRPASAPPALSKELTFLTQQAQKAGYTSLADACADLGCDAVAVIEANDKDVQKALNELLKIKIAEKAEGSE